MKNKKLDESLEYFDKFVSKSCDDLPEGFDALKLITNYNNIRNFIAENLKEE